MHAPAKADRRKFPAKGPSQPQHYEQPSAKPTPTKEAYQTGGSVAARERNVKPQEVKEAQSQLYAPAQLTGFLRRYAAFAPRDVRLQKSLLTMGRNWMANKDTSGWRESDLTNHLIQAVGAAMVPTTQEMEVYRFHAGKDVNKRLFVASDAASGQLPPVPIGIKLPFSGKKVALPFFKRQRHLPKSTA